MLFHITRICSESPTLKPLYRENKSLFDEKTSCHITYDLKKIGVKYKRVKI